MASAASRRASCSSSRSICFSRANLSREHRKRSERQREIEREGELEVEGGEEREGGSERDREAKCGRVKEAESGKGRGGKGEAVGKFERELE
eukprot:6188892-Pleurochrysis_carterae.AAC.7